MFRRVWLTATIASLAIISASPADAQYRLNVEAVFMDRNDGDGAPLVQGQDSVSSAPSYDLQTGYRITLGGSFGQYDVEVIGTHVDDWGSRETGTLVSELVLDDTNLNPVVVPIVPANSLGFNALVKVAASSAAEATESERLRAGATWFVEGTSRFRDYQVNLGMRPNGNPWRVTAGYRHMRLDESQGFGVTGIFDAIDTDDAAVFGDAGNDPNDALSDAALMAAGFTLRQGGGDGFDAFDTMNGPDTLRLYYTNNVQNSLNGLQISGSYDLSPVEVLSVSVFTRAGIYHNNMQGQVNEYLIGSGNDDSLYGQTIENSRHGVAFSGTLGLRLELPITDYISLTAGYEGMYVANVALASNQNGGVQYGPLGNRRYSVDNGDNLILHGGNLGLLVTW